MLDEADDRVQLVIARDEIRNILALYPRAVDRCDEALLRRLYWPDATDDHGAFKGDLDAFIAWAFPSLLSLSQTHHLVGNPAIEVQDDQAESESYYIAYHKVVTDVEAKDFVVGGRYLDRLERRRGEWRISRRIATFDYCNIADGKDLHNFGFSAPESIGSRWPDDPIYKLARSGLE
jgi:hypothetical protein